MVIGHDVFPYREERLAIIRLFIELSCELRGFIFGKGDKDRDDTSVLVACAVFIGELEGRPMNATKVAHFIASRAPPCCASWITSWESAP